MTSSLPVIDVGALTNRTRSPSTRQTFYNEVALDEAGGSLAPRLADCPVIPGHSSHQQSLEKPRLTRAASV